LSETSHEPAQAAVTMHSSAAEKIGLFRSFFRGRRISSRGGGTTPEPVMPACNNTVSDAVISSHFARQGIFGTVNPLPNLEPTWNMAPTRDAPVVRLSRDGQRHLDALRWGLVPNFTKDIKKARKPINVRDDNAARSGMFKDAFARRRCLVPAPAYYEWRDDPGGKTPFAVARVDGEPVALGGVWERWKSPGGEELQKRAQFIEPYKVKIRPTEPIGFFARE
jgi:SOS response associated peptidase (SRAP)